MNELRNLLIGVELSERSAQLCYYDRRLKEPVSVPMRVGTNLYAFPMMLVKLPGKEEWRIGFEAEYFRAKEGGIAAPNPYLTACHGESVEVDAKVMTAEELLAAFLRETLRLLGVPNPVLLATGIGIVCETLTETLSLVIRKALLLLGFRPGQCFLADKGESFFYYCYSLKPDVYARSLALIRFFGDEVSFAEMAENRSLRPHTSEFKETKWATLPSESEMRDEAFSELVSDWTGETSFSGIFLTGEGFGTDWAKISLKTLSKAASHVFEGDNLFVKGACYMAFEQTEGHGLKGRLYLGPSLIRSTVGVDVIEGSQQQFLTLIETGRSCYADDPECDLILDGTEELLVKVRRHGEKEFRFVRLSLDGLPERPGRTTRLHLVLHCPDETRCVLTAEDLGFGELFEATHRTWSTEIEL